jgi:hypothetical protein
MEGAIRSPNAVCFVLDIFSPVDAFSQSDTTLPCLFYQTTEFGTCLQVSQFGPKKQLSNVLQTFHDSFHHALQLILVAPNEKSIIFVIQDEV